MTDMSNTPELIDLYNSLGRFIYTYIQRNKKDPKEWFCSTIVSAIRDNTMHQLKVNMDVIIKELIDKGEVIELNSLADLHRNE